MERTHNKKGEICIKVLYIDKKDNIIEDNLKKSFKNNVQFRSSTKINEAIGLIASFQPHVTIVDDSLFVSVKEKTFVIDDTLLTKFFDSTNVDTIIYIGNSDLGLKNSNMNIKGFLKNKGVEHLFFDTYNLGDVANLSEKIYQKHKQR